MEKGSLFNEPFSFYIWNLIMPTSEIYSVSEITRQIKILLEENFPPIWIEGEVSNYKAHYSGHFYFTLKDSQAQISAVMWRSRAAQMQFELEDGMKVQAFGNLRLYEKSGRYQIDIIRLQEAGIGKLQQDFEALKKRLNEEGLFNAEYKKPLPAFPASIGIITSGTGAAIKDILNILKRRSPQTELIVKPAKVQGPGAAEEVASAIELFNNYKKVDLVIVGRGGGSLEDLWAFNEEILARAIFKSKIPIISAVGHEIDYTITDFVADKRAATPSEAAELAVPDFLELQGQIQYFRERISGLLQNKLSSLKSQLDLVQNSYAFKRFSDVISQYALQIDDLNAKLYQSIKLKLSQKTEKLLHLEQRLDNLNPRQVLKRGYSITYKDGLVVKKVEDLSQMDIIETEFSNGKVNSTVNSVKKGR